MHPEVLLEHDNSVTVQKQKSPEHITNYVKEDIKTSLEIVLCISSFRLK